MQKDGVTKKTCFLSFCTANEIVFDLMLKPVGLPLVEGILMKQSFQSQFTWLLYQTMRSA